MYMCDVAQLGKLQLSFEMAFFHSTDSSCRDRRPVQKAIQEMFSSVLDLYNGKTSSFLRDLVKFFYSLLVQFLQQVFGRLSVITAPELSADEDYNFMLCVANSGHHLLFKQNNNSNLEDIACCLDKFVLLSRRIADSLFDLSAAMLGVKSNLLHMCPLCKEAFLENMLCHRCTGHPTVASCPSLCKDVICNCFPGIVALNDAWNEVLDSVDALRDETGSFPGICYCMNALESSVNVVCGAGPTSSSRLDILVLTVSVHTASVICVSIVNKLTFSVGRRMFKVHVRYGEEYRLLFPRPFGRSSKLL